VTGPDLDALASQLDEQLAAADSELQRLYPGEAPGRQPVHTVYVPADRYTKDVVPEWGARARQVFEENVQSSSDLAAAFGLPDQHSETVYERVRAKLEAEPIEDLRIDFEDGYGNHPDDAEDEVVRAAASALAAAVAEGTSSPFCGIRFKSFEAPTRRRGLRTLDLFVRSLVEAGGLPPGFVVTFPKVTSVAQVEAMVGVCAQLEKAYGLDSGALRFEIQVETPQAILGPDGTALVARMIHSADGRCTALHYGTYDYSASCGIAAAYQSMEHPAADHAKSVMQVAAAGTGVRLSDGSTNVLPVGGHEEVLAAWRLHSRLVRRSLERGYYQGWDMHPAQLPSRFAATYTFYREGLDPAAARLRNYVHQTVSAIMDEPATARALADFVVRGVDCGADDIAEVCELSGCDQATLNSLARRETAR
jgi:citrate lyase beta subunit